MASNVKTCLQFTRLFSLLKLSDKPHICRNFSGLTTLSQSPYKAFIPPQLFGASVQHLPGNRYQAGPANPGSCRTKTIRAADKKISMNLGAVGIQPIADYTPITDESMREAISHQINETLEQGKEGRLYAVVYVRSLQYKVTPGDIIIVRHDFPPNVGDKLRLEKVLAVGGSDFSLFGQPLISRDKVFVEATVVEKTLSHNRVWFVFKKRKSFKKFHLYRERHTMLLINSVRVARLDGEEHRQIADVKDV